jgi:hypothetical protein
MIVGMDWSSVFESCFHQPPGCTPAQLATFTRQLSAPLSPDEIAAVVAQQHKMYPPGHRYYLPLDPGSWRLPARPLPPAYLSLLAWSDGGQFGNGDRDFQFFSTIGPIGVREMTLSYAVPYWLPGALPFAFDGGGVFYLFDLRESADTDGEYPIIAAAAGSLGWDDHGYRPLASSFEDVCRGREPIWD